VPAAWRNPPTVAGGFLYLGARLPEPTGHITTGQSTNPNWEDGEDQLKFISVPTYLRPIDSENQPAGCPFTGAQVAGHPESFWLPHEASEHEWTVELAVPLLELALACQ
jgi:hypothetical protein